LVQQLRWPRRWIILAAFVLPWRLVWADEPKVEFLGLPPLRILGQSAHAHTQGLEIIDEYCYVTARRDDVRPRRALLLRTVAGREDWDTWDITSAHENGDVVIMDHPGGFQSDGERLWIPLAESRRNGLSTIRVFALADMVAGQLLQSKMEFPVDDHIGALAVDVGRGRVIGASWDTETVYVWNLDGQLQRTLAGAAMRARGLGVSNNDAGRVGVAVQDWKFSGQRLFASGLFRGPTSDPLETKSRLVTFEHFFDETSEKRVITLPSPKGIELANEGMDVSDGIVYFLPEDLSATNRLFRVPLAELFP